MKIYYGNSSYGLKNDIIETTLKVNEKLKTYLLRKSNSSMLNLWINKVILLEKNIINISNLEGLGISIKFILFKKINGALWLLYQENMH